jgi:hypothetical protein
VKRPRTRRVRKGARDSQKGPEEVLHRRGLSVLPGRFWMGREGSRSTKGSQNHLVPPQAERPRQASEPGPPASLGPRGCYPKQDALGQAPRGPRVPEDRPRPPNSKRELSGTRLSRQPGFHGWFSPNQLRANACIAASLVAARPCTPPYPGLTMVSERAGQRDPANDLCVRDHFVLGGTSCRLQE